MTGCWQVTSRFVPPESEFWAHDGRCSKERFLWLIATDRRFTGSRAFAFVSWLRALYLKQANW